MENFCFKKDGSSWFCAAAPIEIMPLKTGRTVTGYAVYIRHQFAGSWRTLAQAKMRAQDIYQEQK